MARPGDLSKIVAPSGELEIFEFSCTIIMRNESEDVPLDTFPFGKGNALAHFIKLMPFRVEIVGVLANPPSESAAKFIYGGHERPAKLVEVLRKMANDRTTVQYVTPSFPGFEMLDLVFEDVAITAQNKNFNIYDVRIQFKNVLFYNSWQDLLNVMGRAYATAYGLLGYNLQIIGGIGGAILGGVIGFGIGGPWGAVAGAALGASVGSAAGHVAGVVISGAVAGVAGILHLMGLLPAQRGSLPWQKFSTIVPNRGEYEFEIYPHKHGYPMISVRKDKYSIIENRPIRMGENVLAEVQHDELAKGLFLVAVPIVNDVWEVTNENFGEQTGLFVASFEETLDWPKSLNQVIRIEV